MHSLTPYYFLKNAGKLPSQDTVIFDFGCRDGRQIQIFYDKDYQVVGVDRDLEQIRIARQCMPKADFFVDDIRNFADKSLPAKSYLIFRNVLPFFSSKPEVRDFLMKFTGYPMYFTVFGKNDELPHSSLWWEKGEVETLCADLGATLVNEFEGSSKNLAGRPRRTHIYYCAR